MTVSRKPILILLLLLIFSAGITEEKLSETVPETTPVERAPIDTMFHEGLTKIINATFRDQYLKAVDVTDSLIILYPDHPAPYFFKAAALQGWTSTFRLKKISV